MNTFYLTYCDPWKPEVIQLGNHPGEAIIQEFEKIAWMKELEKVEDPGQNKVQYSPSFGIQNKLDGQSLDLSVVGPIKRASWMIFYTRPGKRKTWFGLREKYVEHHCTEIADQSLQDALESIKAFVRKDYFFLEEKIK